jgi:hypothetical protein
MRQQNTILTCFALAGACFAACNSTGSNASHDYSVTGDACELHLDEQSCAADTAHDCVWPPACEAPCFVGDGGTICPCGNVTCQRRQTGGSDGGSSAGAGCACPNGGVCMEQIGGPAIDSNGLNIECVQACAIATDCSCITGQGRCGPSPNVTGLCVCDNGIR